MTRDVAWAYIDGLEADAPSIALRAWRQQGWHKAAEGRAASADLVRTHQQIVTAIDRHLRPFALTFARYEILMQIVIAGHESPSIGRMSEILQVHPTSVLSGVRGLVRSSYVVTASVREDRRRLRLRSTSRGRDVSAQATQRLNGTVFTRLGLTSAQTATLMRVLERVRSNAGDFSLTVSPAERQTGRAVDQGSPTGGQVG